MKYVVLKTSYDLDRSIKETEDDGFANNCPVGVFEDKEKAEEKAKEWAGMNDRDTYAYVCNLTAVYRAKPSPVEVEVIE